MTDLKEGLWLVEDGELIPIHTAGPEPSDTDKLEEYLDEWDLLGGDDGA